MMLRDDPKSRPCCQHRRIVGLGRFQDPPTFTLNRPAFTTTTRWRESGADPFHVVKPSWPLEPRARRFRGDVARPAGESHVPRRAA